MKISVLGAGAWGTALAIAAAARHDVLLWARSAEQAQALAAERCNRRYLPDVPLPARLLVGADLGAALAHAAGGLLVLGSPMAGLRELLAAVPPGQPAVWLCKGFEAGSGLLGHEVAQAVRPGAPVAVLSGPSFALEVARGQPTALVVAATDDTLAASVVSALHGDTLRIYTSSDLAGVEVGGALKNVMAIATGMLDGMAEASESAETAGAPQAAPGLNARAALITRGLAEMTRLGMALGARPETFMGLSGLGDLVLTATGSLSRNRQVGLMLASGMSLDDTLARLGHVAEGVYSARTVADRAARLGIEMPITEAVVGVLEGWLQPPEAMTRLMARQSRAEG